MNIVYVLFMVFTVNNATYTINSLETENQFVLTSQTECVKAIGELKHNDDRFNGGCCTPVIINE